MLHRGVWEPDIARFRTSLVGKRDTLERREFVRASVPALQWNAVRFRSVSIECYWRWFLPGVPRVGLRNVHIPQHSCHWGFYFYTFIIIIYHLSEMTNYVDWFCFSSIWLVTTNGSRQLWTHCTWLACSSAPWYWAASPMCQSSFICHIWILSLLWWLTLWSCSRLGRRNSFAASALVLALSMTGCALAPNMTAFTILRFFCGLADIGFFLVLFIWGDLISSNSIISFCCIVQSASLPGSEFGILWDCDGSLVDKRTIANKDGIHCTRKKNRTD